MLEKITFINILTFLYSLWWIISVFWYFPTIMDLYKWKPSASIPSYITWVCTLITSSCYWFFVIKDLPFILIINANLLVCIIVLFLAIRLKLKN